MRETGHFYLLVRLGLILGPLLAGVLVVARIFQPAMTATPSPPHSSAASAPPGLVVSSDASILNPPRDYSDLRSAPKTMIPLKSKPEGIDPQESVASFQNGVTAMETSSDDETRREGARLVNAAAIYGYEPARMLIAREFPRSQVIRSEVSSSEAVRFSLDPLFIPGPQSESNRRFLALLAAYFLGRNELDVYATDLLSALSDDRRLQTKDHLQLLFDQLARVPGACTALANAVVRERIRTEPVCSSRLQLQIENFLRLNPPDLREAKSGH